MQIEVSLYMFAVGPVEVVKFEVVDRNKMDLLRISHQMRWFGRSLPKSGHTSS
jgi:hypothetical protein